MVRVGLIGGRGYVGEELLRLLVPHRKFKVVYVGSSSQAGNRVHDQLPTVPESELAFGPIDIDSVKSQDVDFWILAQSNGKAERYVRALDNNPSRFIDISSDFRFDDQWTYGLVERNHETIRTSDRVANPGCYATGSQLSLLPVLDLINAPPVIFGVSGYSGAGRTPSEKNNPNRLRDNFLPYNLSGHGHETEISHHLGTPVCFSPHVADFFRGISLTISIPIGEPMNSRQLLNRYQEFYRDHEGVCVQESIPEISDIRGTHGCSIGGFSTDDRNGLRFVVVCVLDNLLKGAATQVVQNMNLMCGFELWEGLCSD